MVRQFISPPFQTDIRLLNHNKPKGASDDSPKTEQFDSRINGQQNSDGRHSYFPPDESGLQQLSEEDAFY